MKMTREQILGQRLAAQALVLPGLPSPIETVTRLGAVQAQDFGQALLAVATRTFASTASSIEVCLNEGTLIRTHVLRPTWHLVAAVDLRWMVDLTAPRVSVAAGHGYRRFGLTSEVRAQTRRIIEKELASGCRTREELMVAIGAAGFPTESIPAAHHLMDAELALVVCNGPRRGKEMTYDLVDRRVPSAAPVPRDEALSRLALRYIAGHGPATDRDFAWWSGLGLIDARRGLEASRPSLKTRQRDDETFWTTGEDQPPPKGFRWLAGFDEYLIAFTDRSAALDPQVASRAFTSNGIFFPVVLHDGRVSGTWKRKETARAVTVTVDWFEVPPQGAEESRLEWETFLSRFRGIG